MWFNERKEMMRHSQQAEAEIPDDTGSPLNPNEPRTDGVAPPPPTAPVVQPPTGQMPPLHDRCHCYVKTLPGGRQVWKTSEQACQQCHDARDAFNQAQDAVFSQEPPQQTDQPEVPSKSKAPQTPPEGTPSGEDAAGLPAPATEPPLGLPGGGKRPHHPATIPELPGPPRVAPPNGVPSGLPPASPVLTPEQPNPAIPVAPMPPEGSHEGQPPVEESLPTNQMRRRVKRHPVRGRWWHR